MNELYFYNNQLNIYHVCNIFLLVLIYNYKLILGHYWCLFENDKNEHCCQQIVLIHYYYLQVNIANHNNIHYQIYHVNKLLNYLY